MGEHVAIDYVHNRNLHPVNMEEYYTIELSKSYRGDSVHSLQCNGLPSSRQYFAVARQLTVERTHSINSSYGTTTVVRVATVARLLGFSWSYKPTYWLI